MNDKRKVPLMLSVPKECRDQLRKMAAELNLKSQDRVTSASTIAAEIVCSHLDKLSQKEN